MPFCSITCRSAFHYLVPVYRRLKLDATPLLKDTEWICTVRDYYFVTLGLEKTRTAYAEHIYHIHTQGKHIDTFFMETAYLY